MSAAAFPLLRACRPRQWIKNALVLAPLITSRSFRSGEAIQRSLLAMAAFTLLASAVYLINDIADRGRDRAHPLKKIRPIASGAATVRQAEALASVLAMLGLAFAAYLGWPVLAVLAAYAALNAAYSARLRNEPVLDVMIVSTGFLLRPVAGAFAIPVRVSPWLFVVSLLLSLSLALLKRRAELVEFEQFAAAHRPVRGGYSIRFLDQMAAIVTGAGIVSYALYTFQSEHSDMLVLTLPLFLFGVLRYLYLVYERGAGASPEEIFLRDRPLQIGAALYAAAVVTILGLKS
jgi:4-hydroxybenzoate polyprenyltransferase